MAPVAVERAWAQLFQVVSETMATSIREGMDQGGAVHELIRATQVSHASFVQGPFEVPFEVCLSTSLFVVCSSGPKWTSACGKLRIRMGAEASDSKSLQA
jgi:hypothetical protein